ncbi:MAG TPA: 16S rRNA (cytidine(1402)-2'-O)-methyltransferase, partial [Polyangiaceae bacterium]|nr:16S rRNA (cytidine(1402)-2'-O)-methyltransferase [Polyangiaceae bacterium]
MTDAPSERARRPGTLYLVGTPIGNLSDITLRAIETLKRVPRVAAEDTRRTRALLSHLGLGGKKLHSMNANTREHELTRLLDFLLEGDDMALVTDAGMPAISDPGAELVSAAAARDVAVVCIPGPSAVTTAAALSGLVSGPFLFLGFLPRKGKKRAQALARIEASSEPVILFESPLRTARTLADLAANLPNR